MSLETHNRKRKSRDDTNSGSGGTTTAIAKKNKRRKKQHSRDEEGDLDIEAGVNRAFAHMDSQLIADHIAQKTARFGSDLSSVELADLYISAGDIKDTTSWEKIRTKENLAEFLEAFAKDTKKLEEAPKANGAPHTLIVTSAGMRAADLVRSVRKFQTKGSPVAKLFAKHFKLEEQVSFLQKHRTGIAVGTPQRLIDLIENDALSIASLKRLVVDASHIDKKKWGITDMRDTLMPLVKLLTRKDLKERFSDEQSHIDLIFY